MTDEQRRDAWERYEKLVMSGLESNAADLKDVREELTALRIEFARVQERLGFMSAIWGAAAAVLVAVAAQVIGRLL